MSLHSPSRPLLTLFLIGRSLEDQQAYASLADRAEAKMRSFEYPEQWFAQETVRRPCCVILKNDLSPNAVREFLRTTRKRNLNAPVILTSSTSEPQTVLDLISTGAFAVSAPLNLDDMNLSSEFVALLKSAFAYDQCQFGFDQLLQSVSEAMSSLTPRQCEVLHQVTSGMQTKDIAELHGVSKRLIEAERSELLKRFSVTSTPELTQLMGQYHVLNLQRLRAQSLYTPCDRVAHPAIAQRSCF
ncbi:Transcriptional regulatory protein TdiR [Rubripirellula amarantea]|uniref:Transcriptional regulatory protein TdiR n=1 Tax=Rubripirellula amarantea TaxID=2527999 RepID=A0A5C5WKC4_9BACT|nr:LuxR C-terminal-related transcriptional regulator [Rubripirellula amarantea]TWT50312.1 Transcriptional regulatory protein TdiR [Rubripirellula amarantea]